MRSLAHESASSTSWPLPSHRACGTKVPQRRALVAGPMGPALRAWAGPEVAAVRVTAPLAAVTGAGGGSAGGSCSVGGSEQRSCLVLASAPRALLSVPLTSCCKILLSAPISDIDGLQPPYIFS